MGFVIQSANRPDQENESSIIEGDLLRRLNDVVSRIPPEASLPGTPDLIDSVEHLLYCYKVLLKHYKQDENL